MTVTDVRKDLDAKTLTLTAEFDASVDDVWQLWADPRLLERWWGPPTYPATFVEHDLSPGGSVTYFMTGPGGDRHHGWWQVRSVDAPKHLAFEDGFADGDGNPSSEMPITTVGVRIEQQQPGRSRMTIESFFPSTEAMEKLIAMGMDEGMAAALGQIDEILETLGSSA